MAAAVEDEDGVGKRVTRRLNPSRIVGDRFPGLDPHHRDALSHCDNIWIIIEVR